ncbi:hypothetical protein KO498_02360 [Lentibacter algarum]|uniref:hypothetical protein n=1 Tax=Lentibacter algarum TaxID=576131 RepID=UPI001C06DEF6|nr:hypothetical protein [Lentibacter algarum]MBU2980648.1 hypothetical protein [Lentibacter algarum]
MNRFFLRLALTGLLSTLSMPLYANTCETLYAKAKSVCSDLRHTCDKVKICENITAACPLKTETSKGCGDYSDCVLKNTPTIYRKACVASWDAQEGSCVRGGGPFSIGMPEACPTASTDLKQRCEPHRFILQNQQDACTVARRNLAARACDTPQVRQYKCRLD